jgi:hypothetical protein
MMEQLTNNGRPLISNYSSSTESNYIKKEISSAYSNPPPNNVWEKFKPFCEPISAVTTPVSPDYFDVFTKTLQTLRHATEMRSSSSENKDMAVISSALTVIYQLENHGEERAAAREIMAFLENYLSTQSINEPNRLLAEANIENMSSRSLIGLIRSTFFARNKLRAWDRAYARAWARTEKLGKNPASLFIGMPKPSESRHAETT